DDPQAVQVLVDGGAVGTITPAGIAFQSYATDPFTVAAGAHTIAFKGLNHNIISDNPIALLDAVALTRVDQMIVDAGFDLAPPLPPGQFRYDPTGTAWIFSPQDGNN